MSELASEANYLVPLGYIEGEVRELSAQAFCTYNELLSSKPAHSPSAVTVWLDSTSTSKCN